MLCVILRPPRRMRRTIIRRAVHALATCLLAGLLLAPHAQASLGACLSDPVVLLTQGVTVDLYTTIADRASDVQQVNYTLHVPTGLQTIAIIRTSGLIGPKEFFQIYPDDVANTYDSVTEVNTGATGLTVKARLTVIDPPHLPVSASISGLDHQNLPLHVVV